MKRKVYVEETICDFCHMPVDSTQVEYVAHLLGNIELNLHLTCAEHLVLSCNLLGINATLHHNRTSDHKIRGLVLIPGYTS